MTQNQKRLKIWHVLLGILIFIIATWAVYYMQAKANFKAACEKIQAEGYPITMAELNKWYKLPQGEENAADKILEAISHHIEWDGEKAESLPVIGDKRIAFDEPYDANTLQLAEEYVLDNEEMITLLASAAKIKHSRYPIALTHGSVFDYTHLGDIKRAIQTLRIATEVQAENAQPEKAIDTLQTMTAISNSLANEPTLVPHLVRIACDALTIATAERVISRCEFSGTQLQRLADMINKMQTHSMAPGFVGERCFMISAIEDGSYRGYAYASNTWLVAALVAAKVTGLAYNDLVISLELHTDAINASSLPLTEQVKFTESIQKKIDSLGLTHLFARIAMPSNIKIMQIGLKCSTSLRTAQTAIAAQRWRLKNAQLPQNLDQLVPEYLEKVPIDPYDGKPLRYKKSETGFAIYSIGENKIDEAGLKTKMKDITFEIKQ